MLQVLDEDFVMQAGDILGAEEAARRAMPRANPRPPRILLAEDDVEMRRYLALALRRAKFDVVEAGDGSAVLDYIATGIIATDGLDVDVVISDIRMPGANGLRLLSALRSHRQDLPVVLITAFGNPETHTEALLRGARAVIDKPFEFNDLLSLVRRLLEPGTAPRAESQS